MSTISAVTSVTSVMRSNAESVVLIIASVEIFLAKLGVVMRAVLVSVSITVLVVGRPPGTIRIVVVVMAAKVEMMSVESTANKVVIKIELLMPPSVSSVAVATVGTDAESVVTVVASMTVLLTKLSESMWAVLVSVGIAVLVVGRPPGTIRVVVAAVATIAAILLPASELMSSSSLVRVRVLVLVVESGTAMTALTLSANLQASEGASRVGELAEVGAAIEMESISEH